MQQLLTLMKGPLSLDLAAVVANPGGEPLDRHPLHDVYSGGIPDKLPVFIPEDFGRFYVVANGSPAVLLFAPSALYLSKVHPWAENTKYFSVLSTLYGLDLDRVAVFGDAPITFSHLRHESLHDLFASLSDEERQGLRAAAEESFADGWKLEDALGSAMLSELDSEGPFPSMDKNMQYRIIDEYIACFFTVPHRFDRWEERYLPVGLRTMMEDLGYNMADPPEPVW